jgi:hypothetical protein
MSGGEGERSSIDFNECVSQGQLQCMITKAMEGMNEHITKFVTDAIVKLSLGNIGHTLERLDKRLSTLTGKVEGMETRLPSVNNNNNDTNNDEDSIIYDANDNVDEHATMEQRLHRRLHRNHQGMGGNNKHGGHANDDPFAKVKFSIPSFSSLCDAETYLDWEMMIEQKFSSHLVPEQHKVRQATIEFKDFAIIWWNGLAITKDLPTTWEGLKVAMRDHFVPPSYQRDLCKKLQRLEQGNNSVQDHYAELQKGMMCCSMVEETEDKICHFYGGVEA